MNIFITGINNKSGKTVISAGITAVMQSLGYKAGVYKPIQTGAIDKGKYLISPDLSFVKMLDPYIKTHSTYMMVSKATPIIAAEIENLKIKLDEIEKDYNILQKSTDTLIVESTGGLMTPLNKGIFSIHIPIMLKLPILFIVNPAENTINNYLNEINTAKSANAKILGVIINKFPVYSENPDIKAFPALIEEYTDVKVIGLVRNFKEKSVQSNILFNEILNGI
ncbi:TPA: dethiobiotin synthase, partial [Candidatus Avigastranaerophilus faecigallinarum]|nr:dethiobiotin synthase [Candidatus Avigastranaerophilus faecigallinarum]